MFGNDNTQCPDKSGGKNVSRLYIDSSEPSPGGTGKWTKDETLTFECKTPNYKSSVDPGMFYTLLSRATSSDLVKIVNFTEDVVKCNYHAKNEMERLRKEALSKYNKKLRELINSFQVQKIVPDEDIRAQDQVEVIEIDGRPDVIVANRDQTATMMR